MYKIWAKYFDELPEQRKNYKHIHDSVGVHCACAKRMSDLCFVPWLHGEWNVQYLFYSEVLICFVWVWKFVFNTNEWEEGTEENI